MMKKQDPDFWFNFWATVATVVSLAWWGFCAWAIYQIVTWVTAR